MSKSKLFRASEEEYEPVKRISKKLNISENSVIKLAILLLDSPCNQYIIHKHEALRKLCGIKPENDDIMHDSQKKQDITIQEKVSK